MSTNCIQKNPLLRDGTSQAQRVLKALLPEYIAVDERSMDDLVAFAKRFAEQVKYYDLSNTNSGPGDDWVGFFTKTLTEDQRNEPHYALFMAFLEVFRQAQTDLNTITKRHLDFYYRDVLRLKEKPAAADQVYIIFDLVEQVSKSLVAEETMLNAKKDDTGVDLQYAVDDNIVVNKARVESLRALFLNNKPVPAGDPRPINHYRLYASPVANSADGKGAEIEGEEKSWRTFGKPTGVDLIASPADTGRSQGDIGFAFASPILFLGEGSRTVTLTLSFDRVLSLPAFTNLYAQATVNILQATVVAHATAFAANPPRPMPAEAIFADPAIATFVSQQMQQFFNVQFSGEKEWITPESAASDQVTISSNQIIIQRTIAPGQKPVVAYNAENLKQPFRTSWPVVKVTLNQNSGVNPFFYEQFKVNKLVSARIDVDVSDMKELVLQNDDGALKPEQPFPPFSSRPVIGSSFYVGSTEIFQKQLTNLELRIKWHGIPTTALSANDFGAYYHHYSPAKNRSRSNFKVDVDLLDKRGWVSLASRQLFNNGLNQDAIIAVNAANTPIETVRRDPFMDPVEEFNPSVKKGFVRLTLDPLDFGHMDFQSSFTDAAIDAAKAGGSTANIPNEPYTPTIKELSVSYKSSVVINLQQSDVQRQKTAFDARVDQFFHVLPFGVAERHPYLSLQTSAIDLLPQYNDEGSLYIGLSGVQAPQTLSLLFKVSEGSADPDLDRQKVKWSYMVNNEWVDFAPLQLIGDTTNGLLTSGIVRFELPRAITPDNTAFDSPLYWIRASVEKDSSAICEMIDVKAQAVTATFRDNGNDPAHLKQALAAETISSFTDGDANIKEVMQPYSSFGGHPVEDSTAFFTRISERLRHKHRAVLIKDYELLVLERFPKIYKVKCLNHTNYTSPVSIRERAPGYVSLVVITNVRNKNAINPLQPKTSLITLSEIGDFIRTINPPMAGLQVRNPVYEEVRLNFQVRFFPGYDNGFYAKKLNDELRQYLAPWAYDNGKDILFGGKLHKSVVLNFVEERPYVDFVTCFTMDHLIPGETPRLNVDEAVTFTSASVLTSYPEHLITVMETDACDCPDNEVKHPFLLPPSQEDCECGVPNPSDQPADGIGSDKIGSDFIVGHDPEDGGIGFWTLESDFNVQ